MEKMGTIGQGEDTAWSSLRFQVVNCTLNQLGTDSAIVVFPADRQRTHLVEPPAEIPQGKTADEFPADFSYAEIFQLFLNVLLGTCKKKPLMCISRKQFPDFPDISRLCGTNVQNVHDSAATSYFAADGSL